MTSLERLLSLQEKIFDIKEYIPNGVYVNIMNDLLYIHNHFKVESKFRMDFDGFDENCNQIINEFYDTEIEDWVFSYDLIFKLTQTGLSREFIAERLNWFFYEVGYFYCPVYDDLMYFGNYILANFLESDARKFLGCPLYEENYQTDLKIWVAQRFENVLKRN